MSITLPENLLHAVKADLHVHLEGTVTVETLQALAARNGISLSAPTTLAGQSFPAPAYDSEGQFRLSSFQDFIHCYLKITDCIRSTEDIVAVATAWAAAAAKENIVLAEMYFSPTTHLALGKNLEPLFEGLVAAEQLIARDYRIHLRWIFDIVRNTSRDGLELLPLIAEAKKVGATVSAIGLAGFEKGFPAATFVEAFQEAGRMGLKRLVHAGETAGPESIWQAIELLHADRIGHGVHAVYDERLLQYLAESQIPLEVCPWSNIKLQLFSADTHPLKQLIERGIFVLLGSDDPGIFNKTLSDNFIIAASSGVSWNVLEQINEKTTNLALTTALGIR